MAANPSADLDSRLYRAQSWIQRASASGLEGDLDERFIYYWVAFNALYGQAKYKEETRQGEESYIHDFLGKMVRLDRASSELRPTMQRLEDQLLSLLKNQFLRKEYWENGFTDGVDDSLHQAERDVRKALMGYGTTAALLIQVFDCLYVLRIQLFHGCAKHGSTLSANMSETVTPWQFSVEGEQGSEADERYGDDPGGAGGGGGGEGDAAAVHGGVQAEGCPGSGRL